jgi:hypothetical protein
MPAGPEAAGASERTPETLARARSRRGLYAPVFEGDRARGFLTVPMRVVLGLYLLFAVTFASFRVANDGLVYYDFLRRFFGDRLPGGGGYAYQFGTAFFNAPFYLAARAIEAAAGSVTVFGAPLREAAIAVASNVALVLTLYVGWRLLRRLDLPAGPAVLLLALFGSPLFYYTAFQPSYKHAVDALFLTLFVYLLLRVLEEPAPRTAVALGACLAVLVSIRYANIALLPGALLPFLVRRDFARLRYAGLACVATAAFLFALPAVRHIPFKRPQGASALAGQAPVARPPVVRAAGFFIPDPCKDYPRYEINWIACLRNKLGIVPSALGPPRMLVSVRRGLFLWTPLTAFSVLGVALLFGSRPRQRTFLLCLSMSALLLVWIHGLWGDFWTNGFSFSQRFLASLFPFYLLGTAELIRRFRLRAAVVLTLCALFSLYAGFNHYLGYKGISEQDGLVSVLTTKGDRDVAQTFRLIGVKALKRWGLK